MALGFGNKSAANANAPVEKAESPDRDAEYGNAPPPGPRRGSRIDGPVTKSIAGLEAGTPAYDDDPDSAIGKQIELEAGNAIQYRTCSWQKTAALLFAEYICLAIMSFPYSYSVLGLVPGLILTVVVAAIVLYTSIITWEFCLRHPEVKDVCDIGQMLFWNKRWAWYATAVMFALNNTFIQGFHCLTGAKYLNTMTNGAVCTIGFSAIVAVICWIASLPRTFSMLARGALLSAFFTFVSVLLAAIFAGVEGQTGTKGYTPQMGLPQVLSIPAKNTPFYSGMNAFMNISYTFIGQIALPSFIAEMKEPKDFPKALWAVTIAEVILFSLIGAIVYAYTGTQYDVAPAFGTLGNVVYKKVAFSFMIPTIIFLGVLYASITARFIFFRLFAGTRHLGQNTVVGWAAWAGLLGCTWVLAFIIAEVIPFFADLLSLMSSLFDSFFGFIFWGTAYLRMRAADYGPGFWRTRGIRGMVGAAFNVLLIVIGFYFLGVGTYASVESIKLGYDAANFGGPFSCASNGI